MNFVWAGLRAMLPITTGVIPFGAVMGTVFAEANFSFFHALSMNTLVFAGASQLAAVELMTKNTEILVVVVTGVIINLRFMLYSAALSPVIKNNNFFVKILCAYCLTDQNYAVMSAHKEKLVTQKATLLFYFGASLCMVLAWQGSVGMGYLFGNFAPRSWSLEFAVPLSFVALVIPTIKNKKFFIVAIFSAVTSLLLYSLPFNLGLITTAFLSIGLAAFLLSKKGNLV